MMNASAPQTNAQEVLPSRLIHLFVGLSFICIAVGFSYLDRRYGFFRAESLFWIAWGTLGFSAGAYCLGRDPAAGKIFSIVLGLVAIVLAIFPAFFMYTLLRWVSVLLMLVMAARAPMMRTRRDLYLCLTVCFTVSFMVATHSMADWTLWIYLGPAWVFAGLALTWEYASSRAIGNWTKLGMSLGFISMSTLVALALFLFLPRPPVLGFGFIPPGADAPGLLSQSAGGVKGQGKESGKSPGSHLGNASGGESGSGQSGAGGWREQWQGMLKKMRPGSRDPTMPQWQRDFLGKILDWAQALSGGTDTEVQMVQMERQSLFSWLWALLTALLALALARLAYRYRYWLGVELAQMAAWLLASHHPLLAMRLSARAMTWSLSYAGHNAGPGESVREHVAAMPVAMPPLSRRWFGYAASVYCETRFGKAPATPARAKQMHQAIDAATELIRGRSPELAQS